MLHDTHTHLEMLLQRLDILTSEDLQTDFSVLENLATLARLQKRIAPELHSLLQSHQFLIQSTISTDNFILTEKLFNFTEKIYLLIGSHPEIINDTFEVGEYVQKQSKLFQTKLSNQVLGVGECGLDYHYTQDKQIIRKQWDLFESQITLAIKLNLPLVVHTRDAFDDTLSILKQFPEIKNNFLIHCFSEGTKELEQVLDFGGKIGVGGVITFKNADTLKQVVSTCPIDKLLIETDLPFLAPIPYRGKTCLPEYIATTAEKIAEIKGLKTESLWKVLQQNAQEFFGIKTG